MDLAVAAAQPPTPTIGFGTAALGSQCAAVVTMALEAGFRTFDTAEAPYWYDQTAVGGALHSFLTLLPECEDIPTACVEEGLMISTKIPPWELTSAENIRFQAKQSQETLLGFCSTDYDDTSNTQRKYPLDVYFIHATSYMLGLGAV